MVILLVHDKKIEEHAPWGQNFALKYCIAFAAAACAETGKWQYC